MARKPKSEKCTHSLFAFIILYLSIYLYKDFFFPITTTPAVSDTPRRTIHTANCPSSPVLGDGTVALTGFTVGVVSTVVSTVVSSYEPVGLPDTEVPPGVVSVPAFPLFCTFPVPGVSILFASGISDASVSG